MASVLETHEKEIVEMGKAICMFWEVSEMDIKNSQIQYLLDTYVSRFENFLMSITRGSLPNEFSFYVDLLNMCNRAQDNEANAEIVSEYCKMLIRTNLFDIQLEGVEVGDELNICR